jgi:chemosensory pili system protein ChpC
MSGADDELYSMLVPLSQERLLLPRTCVAEVIRFAPPKTDGDGPRWLRGTVPWNGREVPVVSFEELVGLTAGEPGGRTRVVILHALGGRLPSPYFGVLSEGFPQLVRVNREVLQPAVRQAWPENGPVLCQVRMINEYPLIPDLEAIEAMIEEAGRPQEEFLT